MFFRRSLRTIGCVIGVIVLLLGGSVYAQSDDFKDNIYQVPKLKPRDSVSKLKVGDKAPGFTLSAVDGKEVSLSQYLGKKNVVLSFVPAAWTPVCSDQWPGYNLTKDLFVMNSSMSPILPDLK